MKTVIMSFLLIFIAGCANHPVDCATGLIAWDDCLPGTKGYEIRQQSLKTYLMQEQEKTAWMMLNADLMELSQAAMLM